MRKSVVLENYKLFCEERAVRLLNHLNANGMDELAKGFKDFYDRNVDKVQPEIMVYGIYNSGKSTLINALVGKDVAEVGDIPLTDKISVYDWNGYKITDTPGVDAPIEHQLVTEAHLEQCEVVIFVMSAGGGSENRDNYKRMLEVIKAGKRLLLVVNDKGDISNLANVKDVIIAKVIKNLQTVASDNGMHIGEKDYDVIFINAYYACQGNKYNNETLINRSNLPILEKHILEEIKRVDGYLMVRTIVNEMNKLADLALAKITAESSDDLIIYEQLKTFIKENNRILKTELDNKLDADRSKVIENISNCIRINLDSPEMIQDLVQGEAEKYFKDTQSFVESKIGEFLSDMYLEFEKKLENACIERGKRIKVHYEGDINNNDCNFDINRLSQAGGLTFDDFAPLMDSIPRAQMYKKTFEQMIFKTFGEDIIKNVAGDMIKRTMPTIIAKKVGSKWLLNAIPVIGNVIFIGSLIKDGIDIWNAGERRRQEAAMAEAEQERALAEAKAEMERTKTEECKKSAEKVVDDIFRQIRQVYVDYINQVFISLLENINKEAAEAGVQDANRNNTIRELESIISDCEDYCAKV